MKQPTILGLQLHGVDFLKCEFQCSSHTGSISLRGPYGVRHFHTAPGAHHSCTGSLHFNKCSSRPVTLSPGPGRVWSLPGCRLLGSALTRRLAASVVLTVLETARRSCRAFSRRSSSEDLLLARDAFTLERLREGSRQHHTR